MYRPETVRYILLINDIIDNGSQTVQMLTITGSCTERKSLMAKYLRHTFELTRKQAHKVIRDFGFTDLIPA